MSKAVKVFILLNFLVKFCRSADLPANCMDWVELAKQGKIHAVDFPWHVKIKHEGYNIQCGGTLVESYYILTAASCLVDEQTGTLRNKDFTMIINAKIYKKDDIEDIIINDQFEAADISTRNNDLAMIKLKTPIRDVRKVKSYTPGSSSTERILGKTGMMPLYISEGVMGMAGYDFIDEDDCLKSFSFRQESCICTHQVYQSATPRKEELGSGIIYCEKETSSPKIYGVLVALNGAHETQLYTYLDKYVPWLRKTLQGNVEWLDNFCRPFQRMQGGQDIKEPTNFRYLVYIHNTQTSRKCLGSFFETTWLITAAKCVMGFEGEINKNNLRIIVFYKLIPKSAILEIYVSPGVMANNKKWKAVNDIALIRLDYTRLGFDVTHSVALYHIRKSVQKDTLIQYELKSLLVGVKGDFENGREVSGTYQYIYDSDCKAMGDLSGRICTKNIDNTFPEQQDIGSPLLHCEFDDRVIRNYGILLDFNKDKNLQVYASLESYIPWIQDRINEQISHKIEFCDLSFGRRSEINSFYEFPYLARLEIEYKDNLHGFALGVLIHPRFILTAASTFYEFISLSWDKIHPRIHVKLATENYTLPFFQPWEFYGGYIEKKFMPVDYESKPVHDIALLRLEKKVPIGHRTGNRELPLAKFRPSISDILGKKRFLVPAFQDFRWINKIHFGMTSHYSDGGECDSKNSDLVCTTYDDNFWAYPEDHGAPLLWCDDQSKVPALIGIFIGNGKGYQRFTFLPKYISWVTNLIGEDSLGQCKSARRIKDGRVVTDDQLVVRSLARIHVEQDATPRYCWGVLIEMNFVLTTKKCVTPVSPGKFEFKVFLGNQNIKKPLKVIKNDTLLAVYKHPDNDIALIKIPSVQGFSDQILPLLYTVNKEPAEFVGEYGKLFSTGYDTAIKVTMPKPASTFLTIRTNEYCIRSGAFKNMGTKVCTETVDYRVPQKETDIGAPLIMCDKTVNALRVYGLLSEISDETVTGVHLVEWVSQNSKWLDEHRV